MSPATKFSLGPSLNRCNHSHASLFMSIDALEATQCKSLAGFGHLFRSKQCDMHRYRQCRHAFKIRLSHAHVVHLPADLSNALHIRGVHVGMHACLHACILYAHHPQAGSGCRAAHDSPLGPAGTSVNSQEPSFRQLVDQAMQIYSQRRADHLQQGIGGMHSLVQLLQRPLILIALFKAGGRL